MSFLGAFFTCFLQNRPRRSAAALSLSVLPPRRSAAAARLSHPPHSAPPPRRGFPARAAALFNLRMPPIYMLLIIICRKLRLFAISVKSVKADFLLDKYFIIFFARLQSFLPDYFIIFYFLFLSAYLLTNLFCWCKILDSKNGLSRLSDHSFF